MAESDDDNKVSDDLSRFKCGRCKTVSSSCVFCDICNDTFHQSCLRKHTSAAHGKKSVRITTSNSSQASEPEEWREAYLLLKENNQMLLEEIKILRKQNEAILDILNSHIIGGSHHEVAKLANPEPPNPTLAQTKRKDTSIVRNETQFQNRQQRINTVIAPNSNESPSDRTAKRVAVVSTLDVPVAPIDTDCHDNTEWTTVRKKNQPRRPRPKIVGTAETVMNTNIKAAPRKSHFHIFNLDPHTTNVEVESHMELLSLKEYEVE